MSSLIFLGFSVIIFLISYGVMFMIVPIVLGPFFSALNTTTLTPEWADTFNETSATIQFIIPLIPTLGLFILVIKVLMVASVRGRD